MNEADYRIFNLEMPLTDTLNPISKCGPKLSAPTDCVKSYLAASTDLLTLANNHNAEELQSTIEALDSHGIYHFVAGKNLAEARMPYFIEKDGKKIGVDACAEHEFSIAEENYPGANPYNPLVSFDMDY